MRFWTPFLLLTLATGAVNAIGFLALGGVFVSVMTANLALIGIGAGTHDPQSALGSGVAFAGYVAGVLLGGRLAARAGRRGRAAARPALTAELLLVCAFTAGWFATGGAPAPAWRLALLGVAAAGMGCQSGAVRVAGPSGSSTTYMTGALTGVLTDAVTRRRTSRPTTALIAAVPAGAALGSLAFLTSRTAAPLLPVALIAAALAMTGEGVAPPDRRP